MPRTADILVLGGGVIGLNTARLLGQQGYKVTLIEKDTCGFHTSGRNSGVIHAGIYYTPGSDKAKFSVEGNRMLSSYCQQRGVAFQNIGKIIAPAQDSEAFVIDQLYEKATINGAGVSIIDYHEAKEIEPRIIKKDRYLWSPNTSIADNKGVIKALKKDCESIGVEIIENNGYIAKVKQTSKTTTIQSAKGQIECRFLINSAGLYADKIAQDFGFGLNYEILPFLGFYLYGNPGIHGFRTLVYPCPFGKNQFLGVHTTNTTQGLFKLGPTAYPGFWREQYGGLENFNLLEFTQTIGRYIKCVFSPSRQFYLNLLANELRKFQKKNICYDVQQMVTGVDVKDYQTWGPVGIFPQLISKEDSSIVEDFQVERDNLSLHYLNIVSPGWTSALAFTDYIVKSLKID